MGLTPKQERNGVPPMAAGQDSAQRGPIPNVPLGAAEAAGSERWNEGESLLNSPQGSGPGPDGVRVVGAGGGSFWDWDSGLAVSELPGEASDV